LLETLLISVSYELHPFMVGQSHDSFTKDYAAECQECDVILALLAGHSSDVHWI
jgi:hypothetical protein